MVLSSAARGACLTGHRRGLSAIPAATIKAYLLVEGQYTRQGLPRRDAPMTLTSRLHHDVEVAQRATQTLVIGFVLTTFLALALGVTVYDIGKWLTIW